jgi:hypothetical protein
MQSTRIVGQALAILVAGVTAANAAPAVTRAQLGREVKLRILVDKVMQPERDWKTEEWMIRETAQAGFNVYSGRHGFDQPDAIRQVTEWCRQYGIFHLVWMRGSLTAPADAAANGRRMLWADGTESPLWSPNADEFWEWTARYVLDYARLSAADPTLLGVFLDYENYSEHGAGNLYSLSYDAAILARFAAARQLTLPELAPDRRAAWLREQGLHDAFEEFQVAHWRERCRTLRQQVDAIDPSFQFCVYPAPGTPFMVKGIYPEWGTAKAPLILADPSSYGRSSRFAPQLVALQTNRKVLLDGMAVAKAAGIPYLYAGGIDPVVQGADPEFCGRNALMIGEATDGYWVFYEGPKYREDHPAYFRWFAWANKALDEKRLSDWQQPRETPEEWVRHLQQQLGEKPIQLLVPPDGKAVTFAAPVALRGEHLFFVSCRKDLPVEISLQPVRVGRSEIDVVWEAKDAEWQPVAKGTVASKAAGTVTFTPVKDGLHLLGLSAGSCAYRLLSSTVPLAVLAEGGVHNIYGAKRLYLTAPPKEAEFCVTVTSSGAETVRLTLYRPDGTPAASAQTTLTEHEVKLCVPAWEPGQEWAVELGKADTGVLEDAYLRLGKGMPPFVTLTPGQVSR